MASANLRPSGEYGQLELNQVAFRRDGRIEAQCALDATTDFATDPAENGMLLAVDNASRKVFLATAALAAKMPVGLHYSSEHMYDERALGLKHFKLNKGEFLPRIGYLAVGDRFTTNLVAYDNTNNAANGQYGPGLANLPNLGTTAVYGGLYDSSPAGMIYLSKDPPAIGPVLRAVEKTTMPDGSPAIKFVVINVVGGVGGA